MPWSLMRQYTAQEIGASITESTADFVLDTVTFVPTDVSVKLRPSATCIVLVTLDWIMAAGMFADCKIGSQT